MTDFVPLGYADIVSSTETPILDLNLNRNLPAKDNAVLLSDINQALEKIVNDKYSDVCMQVLTAVVPELADLRAGELIVAYVQKNIAINCPQSLDLYVNPANIDYLYAMFQKMPAIVGGRTKIRLHKDSGCRLCECRLSSDRGNDNFSVAQIMEQIRQHLNGADNEKRS